MRVLSSFLPDGQTDLTLGEHSESMISHLQTEVVQSILPPHHSAASVGQANVPSLENSLAGGLSALAVIMDAFEDFSL